MTHEATPFQRRDAVSSKVTGYPNVNSTRLSTPLRSVDALPSFLCILPSTDRSALSHTVVCLVSSPFMAVTFLFESSQFQVVLGITLPSAERRVKRGFVCLPVGCSCDGPVTTVHVAESVAPLPDHAWDARIARSCGPFP